MTRSQKTLAKSEAGRLIIEGIQDSLDQSLSPVSGGKFKRKMKDGDTSILFEDGDLRGAIISKNRSGDEIELGIFKASEKLKAYNHNMGSNNAGNSTMPERRFIPDEDQEFKKKVMDRVDKRLKEIKRNASDTKVRDLETTTLDRLFEEAVASASSQQSSSGSVASVTIGDLIGAFDD